MFLEYVRVWQSSSGAQAPGTFLEAQKLFVVCAELQLAGRIGRGADAGWAVVQLYIPTLISPLFMMQQPIVCRFESGKHVESLLYNPPVWQRQSIVPIQWRPFSTSSPLVTSRHITSSTETHFSAARSDQWCRSARSGSTSSAFSIRAPI